MTSSRHGIRELWCRQLSGDSLSDAESQLLNQAIREEPAVAAELGDDATAHALLLSLEDVQHTEDEFVQSVLQRTRTTTLSSDPRSDTDTKTATSVTAHAGASHGQLPVAAAYASRERRPQKHSQPWLAFSLTLLLFVSLGVMFWFQDRSVPRIVDSTPPERPGEQIRMGTPDDQPPKPNGVHPDATNDVASDSTDSSLPPGNDHSDQPPQLADQGHPVRPTDPDEPPKIDHGSEPDSMLPDDQRYATLTGINDPVWEREDTIGARLGDEAIRLLAGEVEVTFDSGAVVTLRGPVEFQPRSAGQLLLKHGRLSATVPQPATGFTVNTPTAEVVDLGTEFDVNVKQTGESDVLVRKGVVEVGSSRPGGGGLRRWRLEPDGMNQAAFFPSAGPRRTGPLSATVQGADGKFQGVISVNGQTAEFRSRAAFQNVRERVQAEFRTSREGAQQQWQEFVDSMQQNMRGSMRLNGSEVQFGSMQDVMRLQDRMLQQMNGAIQNATQSNFRGSINVNGRELKFTSREEYEAARRAAFGSAATFGAGDVLRLNGSQ